MDMSRNTHNRFNHFHFCVLEFCLLLTLCLVTFNSSFAADALESYKVDPTKISVSGLSSGGFMAVQMEMAFSKTFMGAGIIAGGPYNCAEGDMMRATDRCMSNPGALPPASHFRDLAERDASAGLIDPTSNL